MFRVELIASSLLDLIFKQARLNAAVRASLILRRPQSLAVPSLPLPGSEGTAKDLGRLRIDLVTVFDAILTSGQTREKLQRLSVSI